MHGALVSRSWLWRVVVALLVMALGAARAHARALGALGAARARGAARALGAARARGCCSRLKCCSLLLTDAPYLGSPHCVLGGRRPHSEGWTTEGQYGPELNGKDTYLSSMLILNILTLT
jgi:hypothetical protein